MKLGLVLEGGGSRTYFTCGVLDFFLDEGIHADYVIGTSAGIANGVSYVSRQKGRNLEIAERFLNDKRYMGFRHVLNPKNKSYYNIGFIYEEIPRRYVPFDFEEFKRFKGDVVSVVTNVHTGRVEYLNMPRDDGGFVHLVASCALPILFPLIEIDGKKYMDGGICDPVAVDEALKNGCDKVVVILTRERGYVKEEEKAVKLCARLYKKYPEFSKALLDRTRVYNETLERIWELERDGKVFVIAPRDVGGCKRTERNLDVIKGLYNQGMDVAREVMPELRKYLQLHK